jgi:DNA-binding XRE family transcriptional regulator
MKGLKIQEIELGKERAVIVPIETWQELLDRLEEIEDERLYNESATDSDRSTITHDDLCRRLGRSPLRYLRGQAGMTQVELARRTGLSQSFIAKVEANEKRLSDSSRRKIARALGISIAKL